MEYDNEFVAKKIMRWGSYIKNYTLPEWNEIPDFGLYMEQVISLMSKFLNYLPPELSDEHTITPAAINNYVRKHFMPEPIKKKYYRKHIAYLLIICTLKTNLSINMIHCGLPNDLSGEEMENLYTSFRKYHAMAAKFFYEKAREGSSIILGREAPNQYAAPSVDALILMSAISSGFARLLSEKLILLKDRSPETEETTLYLEDTDKS